MKTKPLNVVVGKEIKRLEVGPHHCIIYIDGLDEPLYLQSGTIGLMPALHITFRRPHPKLSQALQSIEAPKVQNNFYDITIGGKKISARTGDYIKQRNGDRFAFATGDKRPVDPSAGEWRAAKMTKDDFYRIDPEWLTEEVINSRETKYTFI